MKLIKKDKDSEFWPRLLLDKIQEKTNVKIDWDRYVDEDEATGAQANFNEDNLSGGNDFSSMMGGGSFPGMGGMGGGFPGMGGMGDMDFGDDDGDDDEADLPDLEPSAGEINAAGEGDAPLTGEEVTEAKGDAVGAKAGVSEYGDLPELE